VRIFDLGFATPVRLMAGATIGGVAKGSAADRAGLRDGDVLAESVDINPAASSLDLPVTLRVLRAGVPVTVTYQPAGGSQPGMLWHSTCVAIRPARMA
jgi:S1-C subfamily serine protease